MSSEKVDKKMIVCDVKRDSFFKANGKKDPFNREEDYQAIMGIKDPSIQLAALKELILVLLTPSPNPNPYNNDEQILAKALSARKAIEESMKIKAMKEQEFADFHSASLR